MIRYANLAKQRLAIAPNVSRMLRFKEHCQRNGHFVDSNATKKSRLQQYEEGRERNGQFVDANAKKHKQSRATITMSELILNKKESQWQKGVFKHNLAKPNSVTTSISNGPRRKLFLVDNNDDGEDDERSQGLFLSFSKLFYLMSNNKVPF